MGAGDGVLHGHAPHGLHEVKTCPLFCEPAPRRRALAERALAERGRIPLTAAPCTENDAHAPRTLNRALRC